MAEYWTEFDGAMAVAAEQLLLASHSLRMAIGADQQRREASDKARADLEDLKETVARLERIVRGLIDELDQHGHL